MALPFTDAFGAAAAVLGNPPWTQVALAAQTVNYDGAGSAKASAANATTDIIAYDNSNSYSPDQYGQVTIAGGLSSGLQYAEVFVRCSGTGASFKGYQFLTDGASGAGHTELWSYSGGTGTLLRNFATTFTTGDVMRIEVVGTTITCYKNGVSLGTQTSAVAASGAPGIGVFNSSVNAVLLDNFQADNLGALAPVGFGGTRRAFGGRSLARAINSPSGPFDQRGFLSSRIWDYTLLAAAAGTIFNADVSESVTVADTQTAQADFSSTRSEALSVAETEDGSLLFTVARVDALAATDSQASLATFGATLTDALTAAESQTGSAVFASARTEALTAADTETGLAVFSSALTESLAAADTETGVAVFSAARVETLTAADSSDGNVGAAIYNVTRTEALTVADAEVAAAVFATAGTEALAASDSEASTAVLASARAESVTAADSETASASMGVSRSDSLNAADSSTGVPAGPTATFTFRITGGPTMSASLTGGRSLRASMTGNPTLSSTIDGGPS